MLSTPGPRKAPPIFMLSIFRLLIVIITGVRGVTFEFVNDCKYTVWPGVLSGAGWPLLADGGFVLESGKSTSVSAPSGWSGRFWGRTGCSFDTTTGAGNCASADCGGKLECGGAGAKPPATLAEITLGSAAGNTKDYYDVSLVDGYNLPIAISPAGGDGNCSTAGCDGDVNTKCPLQLQVLYNNNEVVACKSACDAFQSAQFCCQGAYGNPSTCAPSSYSLLFKAICPHAYSYAYDDASSIFTCSGAPSYTITFCPPSSSSVQILPSPTQIFGLVFGVILPSYYLLTA